MPVRRYAFTDDKAVKPPDYSRAARALGAITRAGEGVTFEDAALAAMRAARSNFMAPSDDEAFVGAVGALIEAFPDLPVMQEAQALGDRSNVLAAVIAGVPVDMEAAEAGLTPFPDPHVGLIDLWNRSERP